MIEEKRYIRDRIDSISNVDKEMWESFPTQFISDIGIILEKLYHKIQDLEEKLEAP